MNRFDELLAEFRAVLGGRALDIMLPPLAFLLVNVLWGLTAAMATALVLAALLGVFRWQRGDPLRFALGGAAGVLGALGLTWLLGRAEGFFLPGIVSTALTALLALGSLLTRMPLTAWSSHLARRWPRDWYAHPQVRPAYAETTALWALYFGVKLLWQAALYRAAAADTLAWVQALTGWPALLLLLAVTYLYGSWRLSQLGGPAVEEFQNNLPPPWQGQQKGF
ncbi:MAG: hypothetical protein Fur0018_22610 [Anaerolineales bacterium]